MNEAIRNIEPTAVWSNFADLNAVPRASKKEEKVRSFIRSFGQQLGLETIEDKVGNIIIRKPATQGMESRKKVILQSHLDMVHQKNAETVFDFDNQGIEMWIDGDWVKANGTTLGADNGLGVASIMAVLQSTDIPHPSIEALFTIDEETGMTGALGIEPAWLTGEILLNLDTEEDDSIEIGCAGGIDVTAVASYPTIASPIQHQGHRIAIKGLQGGHSGMDIHKGLGNANKLMARIIYALCADGQGMLASLDGGSLRNAIPRECTATISVHPDYSPSINAKFEQLKHDICEEYKYLEPQLSISISSIENPISVLDPIAELKLLHAILGAHNGVYRMSPQIEGLVEASNNVARIELNNGQAKILCLTRSSVESTKTALAQALTAVFRLADMDVSLSGDYPGWTPNIESPILKVMTSLYASIFNHEAHVGACHAGLECGIIGRHYPGMDMISFGPTIKGAHSPDEKASISSFQKFWKFLQAVLKNTPEK